MTLQRCDHEPRCDSTDVTECTIDYRDEDGFWREETWHYCPDHIQVNGFCICGVFQAGLEEFSFGPLAGFCDNCRAEIEADFYVDESVPEEYYPEPY